MQETSLVQESAGSAGGSMRSTGTRPAAIRAQGLERRFSGEPSSRNWPSTREEISL
jgi:hypothetical protein